MSYLALLEMNSEQLLNFWGKYHLATKRQAVKLGVETSKQAQQLANLAINRACYLDAKARQDPTTESIYLHSTKLCLERLPNSMQTELQAMLS